MLPSASAPSDPELYAVLARSRDLGFLGPGAIGDHITHANAFEPLVAGVGRVLDLGSGGGVPGLILARALSAVRFCLLDAGERRVAFLRDAVRSLGLDSQVEVELGRAEDLARRTDLREAFDIVVARGFAGPSVTAECSVGFLTPGGRLLVSEPRDGRDRWPANGLDLVGLVEVVLHHANSATIREFRRTGADITHLPRAVGLPGRRPLFPDR